MALKAGTAGPHAAPARHGRVARELRADHLTLARLLLLPLPVAMLYQDAPGWRVAALVVFVLLGLTDVWDGRLARRQGPSRVGEILDIVADRVFLVVVYGVFANLGIIPVAAFVMIVAREFLVGAVRALPSVTARTGRAGKWRTTVQMYGAGLILLLWIALTPSRPNAAAAAISILISLIVAVTVATGVAYLGKARLETEAGAAGHPVEILGIVATTLVVPLLWAPLADRNAALALPVVALVAGELARLLLESDLLPGRFREISGSTPHEWRGPARLAYLAAGALALRALPSNSLGRACAIGLVLAMTVEVAIEVVTWLRRSGASDRRFAGSRPA